MLPIILSETIGPHLNEVAAQTDHLSYVHVRQISFQQGLNEVAHSLRCCRIVSLVSSLERKSHPYASSSEHVPTTMLDDVAAYRSHIVLDTESALLERSSWLVGTSFSSFSCPISTKLGPIVEQRLCEQGAAAAWKRPLMRSHTSRSIFPLLRMLLERSCGVSPRHTLCRRSYRGYFDRLNEVRCIAAVHGRRRKTALIQ